MIKTMTSNVLLVLSFLFLLINRRLAIMDDYLCAFLTLAVIAISLALAKKQYSKEKFTYTSAVTLGLYLMVAGKAFATNVEILLDLAGIGLMAFAGFLSYRKQRFNS